MAISGSLASSLLGKYEPFLVIKQITETKGV